MNIYRRLVCVLLVLLVLSACGTVTPSPTLEPIATATAPNTAIPTSTPDPTPTQEMREYIIVNANPFFTGVSEHALDNDDQQRRQVLGAGYTPTARWYYESGVRVAPWIHRNALNDGSGRARLAMEFTQIAGEFGMYTLVTLEAGQCYVLKQRGYLSLRAGDMNNLALGARVYIGTNGSAIELQEQGFAGQGSYEIAWRLRPMQDVSTNLEIYLMVRWAEFSVQEITLEDISAQAASINEISAFIVERAPDDECPPDATWQF